MGYLRCASVRGPGRVIRADDLSVMEDAEVTLLVEKGKQLGGVSSGRDGDRKRDHDRLAGEVFHGPGGGGFRRIRLNRFARVGVVGGGEAGEEEFEIVVDFREGADGRAGRADMVFLFDGDGGWDAFDGIHLRFVHAVEKLAHVGREGLHVAALALGIKGVEGERGFAGAGRAGDDGEFAERDRQVKVLQIVLAATVEANGG